MFISFFYTILRSVAIPIVAFILLRNTFIGEQGALLAIAISLTVSNVSVILYDLVRILPNALLLRGNAITQIIVKIIIEIVSTAGFWFYFYTNYVQNK